MYCSKCGRKGDPVRIACLICNATLPGWPTAFQACRKLDGVQYDPKIAESAFTFMGACPEPVICQKCGTAATDGRIACLGCDQSFPRPFSLVDGYFNADFGTDPNIAYYEIVCQYPESACDACRKLNGVQFTREHFPEYGMPIKTCKNPICWCSAMGNTGSEAVKTAELLRSFGGRSNDARAVAYFEAQKAARAQERERYEREREASRKASREQWAANLRRENFEGAALRKSREARVFEKNGPDQAVLLYREVLGIYENIARSFSVPPAWPRLDHVYDRLTVSLSRAGRQEEALAEIARYRALGRESQPASATWHSIVSRESRIKKRLEREKTETDEGTGLP